jgi:hypothetical protein
MTRIVSAQQRNARDYNYLIVCAGREGWITAQQDIQDDPDGPDVNLTRTNYI